MSVVGPELRLEIERRARFRCEYCLMPMRGQVATFPIDHILPRLSEGETTFENLALACPHCNGRKWAHTRAIDPQTGNSVELFNPRTANWDEHFQWSTNEPGKVEGKTPCGRATVALLELNHLKLIEARELSMEMGMFHAEGNE